jgi:hypothetical protein
MTIRRIWNMQGVAKSALVLAGLCVIGLATGLKASAQSGTFTLTGSLNTARYNHTATLLQNGEVLVAGGVDVTGNAIASAELYNLTTAKWTVTGSMSDAREAFTATLLQSGEVLVAGGFGYFGDCLAAAELYNPSTGEWTPTGSMTQGRCSPSATLLVERRGSGCGRGTDGLLLKHSDQSRTLQPFHGRMANYWKLECWPLQFGSDTGKRPGAGGRR